MDSEKERVVFVEFDSDGTPYSVTTTKNEYDFAMSKQYGLLYHESGSASRSIIKVYQSFLNDKPITTSYWAASDVAVEEIGACVRLETLPDEYTPEKLFDAIDCYHQIVWCGICDDCMPDSESSFCEHVWYCLECGEISTPDERCDCKEEEE